MLESRADPGAGRRVTAAHGGDMPRRRYKRWPRQVTPIRAKSHAAVAGTRRPSGGSRPSASSTLAAVAGRDYLREAQGRTLTKGQILDPIVRVVEGMAQRDEVEKALRAAPCSARRSGLRSRRAGRPRRPHG